jgi:hypothetical protein
MPLPIFTISITKVKIGTSITEVEEEEEEEVITTIISTREVGIVREMNTSRVPQTKVAITVRVAGIKGKNDIRNTAETMKRDQEITITTTSKGPTTIISIRAQ